MKKIISALVACMVMLTSLIFAMPAMAAGSSNDVTVVFLIDGSASMQKSDPDNLRLTGIKMFSDLCDLEMTSIGFVVFGDNVFHTQELTPVNAESDRTAIKNSIDGLTELQGSTDIGLGMQAAVDMMLSSKNSNKEGKFIIFLSDGKTVIPKHNPDRTLEQSQADTDKAIALAAENGIPVYTIGLNANGDVDSQLLKKISDTTYAETHVTTSAAELSKILSEIYAHHAGAHYEDIHSYVSDGDYEDVEFSIEDGSVVAANLVIMHEGGLDDVKLINPSGKDVPLDSGSVTASRENTYTRIKIMTPEAGQWKLSSKAPVKVKVDIKLIKTHNFQVEQMVENGDLEGTKQVTHITAALKDDKGNAVTDENVLALVSGEAVIRNEQTGKENKVKLTADGNVFKADEMLEAGSNYSIHCDLKIGSFGIRSDVSSVDLLNAIPDTPETTPATTTPASAPTPSEPAPEPLNPMIFIIIGGAVVLLVVVIIVIKAFASRGQVLASGKFSMSINVSGVAKPPATYDVGRYSRMKRSITMRHVLCSIYTPDQADQIIPSALAEKIKITLKGGNMRFTTVKGINFTGGINVKGMVLVSNRGRLSIQYTNPQNNAKSTIALTYTIA